MSEKITSSKLDKLLPFFSKCVPPREGMRWGLDSYSPDHRAKRHYLMQISTTPEKDGWGEHHPLGSNRHSTREMYYIMHAMIDCVLYLNSQSQ